MIPKNKKSKRYTRTTAKQHVLQTVPYRVTKQSRKELLDSTDISTINQEIDNALKNVLVALANTPVETYGVSLVNNFKLKLDKKINKARKNK